MRTVTTTPFGRRPVTADLLDHQAKGNGVSTLPSVGKWEVLNSLSVVRDQYGIGDRTLALLQVLLTFHPHADLTDGTPMIVFASNASICERAHGMPESTLRRHLAALVKAGLILRHDSPNGKRYARRGQGGQITRAFGFDLRPLLTLAPEIAERAAAEMQRRDRIKELREEISLMLRDATKLILYAIDSGQSANLDAFDDQAQLARRYLRRKLSLTEIEEMHARMQSFLTDVHNQLGVDIPQDNTEEILDETPVLSGNEARNERHYQSSKKENLEIGGEVPIRMVLDNCPEIAPYLDRPPRTWPDLVSAMCRVAPMTGIDARGWSDACRIMGPEHATATLAAMVQRIGEIGNPGAYFRTLTKKAGEGRFSPIPMLKALEGARVAS
jgi:replication initiation protein RepC